ncbi:hypothetical protein GF325_17635, partial [Candidatus Bathyarchaeota archaeon]|nr:hypothetical protein [Candidatus Bathyarchaeota archaeon]
MLKRLNFYPAMIDTIDTREMIDRHIGEIMSDKKPSTMDEFMRMRQKDPSDKKKKKKQDKEHEEQEQGGNLDDLLGGTQGEGKDQTGDEDQEHKSMDLFTLLEETHSDARQELKEKVQEAVKGLSQAYNDIPVARIAKRVGEDVEQIVDMLEDLIIEGIVKARLTEDKIIPIEGESTIIIADLSGAEQSAIAAATAPDSTASGSAPEAPQSPPAPQAGSSVAATTPPSAPTEAPKLKFTPPPPDLAMDEGDSGMKPLPTPPAAPVAPPSSPEPAPS